MSEDRAEKALQAMKNESVDPEQLKEAGARVRQKLGNPATDLCSEFQAQFREYLDGRLGRNRRLLIEDHLARCPLCRARLAEEKRERNLVPMPARRDARWPKWGRLAAAAAVIFAVLYLERGGIDSLLAPSGPRATVVSLQGSLYLVPGEMRKRARQLVIMQWSAQDRVHGPCCVSATDRWWMYRQFDSRDTVFTNGGCQFVCGREIQLLQSRLPVLPQCQ